MIGKKKKEKEGKKKEYMGGDTLSPSPTTTNKYK